MDFAIEVETIDEATAVVAATGELDLFRAPELKRAISQALENDCLHLVIDLSATTFIDSTTLGVLIGAFKRLRAREGTLTIVNVDANIARTLEITGLDEVFKIHATRDEAIAGVGKSEA